MNEPAITEAVKTDLPSPKPNRRKRLALRFAFLVAAVSVLGAAYWFTRPPELAWWRSPEIRGEKGHVLALIPQGWETPVPLDAGTEMSGRWEAAYRFVPVDRTPKFLRWISATHKETAEMVIYVIDSRAQVHRWSDIAPIISLCRVPGPPYAADRWMSLDGVKTFSALHYERANLRAFNRTYRQICNSLTIE
jgi:hypothetical protein